MATHLTNPSYAVVTVGNTSTAVAAADADRKTLQIINISDTCVWLALDGGTPTVEGGIPVYPGCACKIDSDDYTNGAVNGISAVASKKVMVLTDCPDVGLASSVMSLSGGGGASAGGGNMVYFSPRDFTAAYASGTTLTISGLPFTPQIEEWQYLIRIKSDGSRDTFQSLDDAWEYSGGTLTVPDATFDAGDLGYLVVLFGPDKAYSKTQDATKVIELSPISNHNAYTEVADETNVADDTYDYYLDVDSYSSVLIIMTLDGDAAGTVTASLEFTAQDDGTLAASCLYVDDTGKYADIQDTGGGGATKGYWLFTEKGAKYLHIQVVVASGGNAADYTIMARAQY